MNKVLLSILLSATLAGCTGLVSPGGAPTGAPEGMSSPTPLGGPGAAQKGEASDSATEDGTDSLPPPEGTGPEGPPQKTPVSALPITGKFPTYAAVDTNTHPGGVSALPADVGQGGKAKTIFDYVYTATSEPVCKAPSASGEMMVHFQVSGTVGAVLMDGTKVPITSGCEALSMRFQSVVAKNTVRCQDLALNEDCRFQGTITIAPYYETAPYPRYEEPAAFVLKFASTKDCADISNIDARDRWNEWVYLPINFESLPMCSAANFPGFEKHMMQKSVKP